MEQLTVKACYEKVTIPTYGIGKPEKNPMFLEKRVYQGSSGVVYPHPVVEKILDEKTDQQWNAVFLENKYLKIMILPELGGRIQMAYDKTKQRHFIYYNQVIKPALVGLTGPWISGGIEFNWPQHHRPSTYEPVDHKIEENADGSITVWCSELERMFRTRGMAGFTLYPDKAYLEIKVKLFNRTNYPQTFLWWANPAVKVNDHYQSVFPPDVHAVFDHGKRDVSAFPIAKGTYYKVDYSPGTDISRYKNIPVPTSYMAVNSKYNFVGGYENDSKGGLLHIANHHVSPGKKQWTWGNGDFGQAWDRNLTDEDGPYIELMCGVYTDNQPDFSWIMPGEEKSFNQYFMPYRDLGVIKNATKDAMVNLEIHEGFAVIKAYTTASYPCSKVMLQIGNRSLLEETFDFSPEESYEKMVVLSAGINTDELSVNISTSQGTTLVEWKHEPRVDKDIPEPAKAAEMPCNVKSNEQLYLTGLHLEQYRHATYDARDYYREALSRDPKDYRCNNAMGLWYLRRGQFSIAENYFRKAVETITERNPNPIDGEPYYNLGLALRLLGKDAEAYDVFYKSVWNAAWMDNGYFQLARLDAKAGKWSEALELVDRSLIRNWHNHKARQLKVSLLRKAGRKAQALALIEESLGLDRFNFNLYFEKHLLTGDKDHLHVMEEMMRGNIHNYIEFALDYAAAGLFSEAIQLMETGLRSQEENNVYPMAFYYKAWMEGQNNEMGAAHMTLLKAANAAPDYCFPNQTEAVIALQWAIQQNVSDGKAPYYLGNFWYNAKNFEEAIDCWEKSIALDDSFPTPHRNLALAYFNKRNDAQKALGELQKAFSLDPSDARVLMELDQLFKRLNHEPDKRLHFLEEHLPLVAERDDLYLEWVSLLNFMGNHQKAYDLLMAHKFHPWEGGEGKVIEQYLWSLTELAKRAIMDGEYHSAIELLKRAEVYPENFGEGKLIGAQENEIHFWIGVACKQLGDLQQANEYWEKAATGMDEPSSAMFYNDQQPDTIFYQGLALLHSGHQQRANERFEKLISYGKAHIDDEVKIDYFAVSLPDLLIWDDVLNVRNRQLCLYLMGLGELGKGNRMEAYAMFSEVLKINLGHKGAHIHFYDRILQFAEQQFSG